MDKNEQYEQYDLGYNTGWNIGANGGDWDTTGLHNSDSYFLEGLEHGYDDGYESYLESLDEEEDIECFLDEDSDGNTLQ